MNDKILPCTKRYETQLDKIAKSDVTLEQKLSMAVLASRMFGMALVGESILASKEEGK